MEHFYGREFDKDGTVASEGTVKENLLSWLMEDGFVLRCPPKSTGREVCMQMSLMHSCQFPVTF